MRALKGLLIYIGIVLAIIVGIAILLFAGMYFFPSFRIMGVGVVHGHKSHSEAVKLSDYSGFDAIEVNINSRDLSVTVESKTMEKDIQVVADLSVDVFGLAYDITEYGVVLQESKVVDNVLRVSYNITEPNGLISYTGNNVKVSIPDGYPVTLSVTTDGGDILVTGKEAVNLDLKNLNISTTSGYFDIEHCFHDVANKVLNLDNLTITTKSGNLDFKDIENINVKNTVKIDGNDAKIEFKNLNASMNIIGSGIKLKANHIKTGMEGFEFFCDNGTFDLVKLETPIGVENAIVTENGNINIEEVIGDTGIVSTYGSINIGALKNNTIIKSDHGNVFVKNAFDDITVTTEYGNITVENYLRNGIFTSKRGNINVKNTGEYEDKVYTKIVNEDGDINVDNNINKLLLETTGKSRVSVIFRQIKGELIDPNKVYEHRVIIGTYSSATVYLPTINFNTPFKFKAYGNISGEISGLIPEYEGNTVKSSEDYQFFPRASEEYKEACQRSCYFEFFGTITFKGYQNI